MTKQVKIFLSWCHLDRAYQKALLRHLMPALARLVGLEIEWWQDSHLTCGERLMPGVLDRIDEADFGLLLVSPKYLASEFIRTHELPRFVGDSADKAALPVQLTSFPSYNNSEFDLAGLDKLIVFNRDDKSFAEATGVRREKFANELAVSIQRRVLGQNGYRPL